MLQIYRCLPVLNLPYLYTASELQAGHVAVTSSHCAIAIDIVKNNN
jgi:hypothetical protein